MMIQQILVSSIIAFAALLNHEVLGQLQAGIRTQVGIPQTNRNVATESAKVTALPECSARFMIVSLKFNRTLVREFYDWIVIGTNSNAACRHQVPVPDPVVPIELPGAFEPTYPTLAPVFHAGSGANIDQIDRNSLVNGGLKQRNFDNGDTIGTSPEIDNLNGRAATTLREKSTGASLDYAYVYYLVLPMLLMALLCMVCGCLFALIKRRKVTFESRNRVNATNKGAGSSLSPMGNVGGAEMGKLGIGNLWWTGRPNNDPLLSHDYMISSNSTKDAFAAMSASEAGNTSPTSSGGDETGLTSKGQQRMPPAPMYDAYETVLDNQNRQTSPNFDRPLTVAVAHDSSGQKVPGHSPTPAPRSRNKSGGGNQESGNAPRSYSEWKAELLTRKQNDQTTNDLYTPVDRSGKNRNHASKPDANQLGKFRATPVQIMGGGGLEEADRSITQLNSAGLSGHLQFEHGQTLHAVASNRGETLQAAGSSSTLEEKLDSNEQMEQRSRWLNECISAVRKQFWNNANNHNGQNGHRPNKQEIERFINLIETDELFANWLWRSAGMHDYETLSRRAQYSKIMNRDKWTTLIHTLTQLNYMKRLDNVLEACQNGATTMEHTIDIHQHTKSYTDERGPIVEDYGIGGSGYGDGKRRYVKRAHAPQAANAPRKANPDEVQTACSPTAGASTHPPQTPNPNQNPQPQTTQQITSPSTRHFTHNSFTRTKEQLQFVAAGAGENIADHDRDTTEMQEGVHSVARRHHSTSPPAQTKPHRPQNPVQVYVGDVSARPLPQAVRDKLGARGDAAQATHTARYAAMLESTASFASTTYEHWQHNDQ